ILFWPISRILVGSGALLNIEYIDPDPSGQCQGKRGVALSIGVHMPVTEWSILGPRSTMSGAKDATLTLAKSKKNRRCTHMHQQAARAPAQRTSGIVWMGYPCFRPSSTPCDKTPKVNADPRTHTSER